MGSLLNIGIKQADGTYKNYTVSINDNTNEWGKNVSVWEQQTKEEREAKAQKNYCGNGSVFWTDGTVKKAEYIEKTTTAKAEYVEKTTTAKAEPETDDLPF